ncbi:hypothetical protein BP5796_12585 [Coleophoma crateriformis]|uniref:Uncharacterized protein n=1 Tax=Coleophoma crateriformis TaxID=565419 RepID=A0A3D8Q8M3_9HELO|nr:hypothetical protein BP5796_12585 [Coleophoma crateriformis]
MSSGNTQQRRYVNKHRQVGPKSFRSIPVSLTEEVRSNLEDCTEPNNLREIYKYFSSSPEFEPISSNNLKKGALYIKPPSARIHTFALGGCNGIMSTLYDGDFGLTQEWGFLPVLRAHGNSPLSQRGDSGSSILNNDFTVEGMIWGGDKSAANVDVTYATPISIIIRHVEERMGWVRGSLQRLTSDMDQTIETILEG